MWTNKVVIITGSGSGIGKQLALLIAERGGRVIIHSKNKNKVDACLAEINAKGFAAIGLDGDISIAADAKKLIDLAIENFGTIDVLINNAGISASGSIAETHPAVFDEVIKTNLSGSFYTCHFALPHLIKSKGSILFISSVAAIHGLANHGAYSCSKNALSTLSESLRIELNGTGVFVGIAFVGFTRNDEGKKMLGATGDYIPVPVRENFKRMETAEVALGLIHMIEKRKIKKVFSGLGKLTAVLNRISPKLIHLILSKNMNGSRAQKLNEGGSFFS